MSKKIKELMTELKTLSTTEGTTVEQLFNRANEIVTELNDEYKGELEGKFTQAHIDEAKEAVKAEYEIKIKELENRTPADDKALKELQDNFALLQKQFNEEKTLREEKEALATETQRKLDSKTIYDKLHTDFKNAGAQFPELLAEKYQNDFRLSDDKILKGEGDDITNSLDFVTKHKEENQNYYSAVGVGGGSGTAGGQATVNNNNSPSSFLDIVKSVK